MKRQVRAGVFETKSSSTHSLTICTEQEFQDWKSGKLLFITWDEEFVPADSVTEEEIYDGDYQTYRDFGSGHLESFESHFTTPSGDKMVAFGEYGFNG